MDKSNSGAPGRNLQTEDALGILETAQPLVDHVSRIQLAGGRQRWLSATKVPIKDRSGDLPSADEQTPRGNGQTILLAEDQPEVRMVAKAMLEKSTEKKTGFTVEAGLHK